MTERTIRITPNTIGSMKCEISLNDILVQNKKLVRPVMQRYNDFRQGLTTLVKSDMPKEFKVRMTKLWRDVRVAEAAIIQGKSKEAYTFLLCCMAARYRRANLAIRNGDQIDGWI